MASASSRSIKLAAVVLEGLGAICVGLVFRFPILGIVDSQTKNQAARRNIGQRDEFEAGRKRMGSVIQKTDL
jgi:hypothetical protein